MSNLSLIDELVDSHIPIHVKDPIYVREAKVDARNNFKEQLRQGFEAAMLEVIGINEPPSEYGRVDKAIRNKLRAEQRQALETLVNSKGEDDERS